MYKQQKQNKQVGDKEQKSSVQQRKTTADTEKQNGLKRVQTARLRGVNTPSMWRVYKSQGQKINSVFKRPCCGGTQL